MSNNHYLHKVQFDILYCVCGDSFFTADAWNKHVAKPVFKKVCEMCGEDPVAVRNIKHPLFGGKMYFCLNHLKYWESLKNNKEKNGK